MNNVNNPSSMAETKELKRRVRDIIDPSRHLGHVDSHVKKPVVPSSEQTAQSTAQTTTTVPSSSPSSTNPPALSNPITKDSDAEAPAPKEELTGPLKPGDANDLEKEKEEEEEKEKVVIPGGEGVFYCKPGDEDCG